MTEEMVSKLWDEHIIPIKERLNKAVETGHLGTLHSAACDVTTELVGEIIRLNSELEYVKKQNQPRQE